MDLVFHFRLGDTSLTCNSTGGTLIGRTIERQAIVGSDAVRVINPSGGPSFIFPISPVAP